jgi:hypothetical protein
MSWGNWWWGIFDGQWWFLEQQELEQLGVIGRFKTAVTHNSILFDITLYCFPLVHLFTRSLNSPFVSSWTPHCGNTIVMYTETCIIFLKIGPIFTMVNSHSGPRPPHYWGFMITLRHTTVGRTPLDKWSARRRDLYLTTRNTRPRRDSHPQHSKPEAADPRLRPSGHWDRQTYDPYSDEFRAVGKINVDCEVVANWEVSWNPTLLEIHRLSTATASISVLKTSRTEMVMPHRNGMHKEAQVERRIYFP